MARYNEVECLNAVIKLLQKNRRLNMDGLNYKILSYLSKAKPIKNSSLFPDFVFEGGVVEHFLVSSSKETRKGSDYKIEESKNNVDREQIFEKEDKNFLESDLNPWTFSTCSFESVYKNGTYEWFCESVKRNFESHIESLKNSKFKEGVVIFLLEQQDGALGVYEKGIFKRFYSMVEDRGLLEFFKNFFPMVDYVIFNVADIVEIIDLSRLDELIEKSKSGLDIRGGRKVDLSLKLYLDIG